jgi:hypothetical protein
VFQTIGIWCTYETILGGVWIDRPETLFFKVFSLDNPPGQAGELARTMGLQPQRFIQIMPRLGYQILASSIVQPQRG